MAHAEDAKGTEGLNRAPEREGARGRWPQATAGEMSRSEGVN
jgi:hypothetical protein